MPKRQNRNANFYNNFSSNYNSSFNIPPNHSSVNMPFGFDHNYPRNNSNFYGNYQNYQYFPGNFKMPRNYQNYDSYDNYQLSGNFQHSQGNFGSYQNRRRNRGTPNPQGFYNNYGNSQTFQGNSFQGNYYEQDGYLSSEDGQNLTNYCDNLQSPVSNSFKREFVSRKSLYVKSESPLEDDFSTKNQCNENEEGNFYKKDEEKEQGPSWTDSFWKKCQGEDATSDHEEHDAYKGKKTRKVFTNEVEKTLAKMLAKPVEMSKGKSLLMKMGWDGGGLGKDGEGIVEPIAPKATYASTTMGLGIASQREKPVKTKKQTKKEQRMLNKKQTKKRKSDDEINEKLFFKGRFRINILNTILNFVMNDLLEELKFESQLSRAERKKIHNIVAHLNGSENGEVLSYMEEEEVTIVRSILQFNKYVLTTQSEGVGVKRRISIFKEAPPYVYHIVPVDLRDETEKIKADEIKDNNLQNVKIVKNVNKKNANLNKSQIEAKKEIVEKKDVEMINDINDSTQNKIESQDINIQDTIENETKKIEAKSQNVTIEGTYQNNTEIINISEKDHSYLKNHNEIIDLTADQNKKSMNSSVTSDKNDKCEKYSINNLNNINEQIVDQSVSGTINETTSCVKLKDPEDVLSLIIDYFIEFTKDEPYEEFRFLGPFENCERESIDKFFDLFNNDNKHENREKVLEAMKDDSVTYEVVEDDNGSLFIRKMKKVGESAASVWKKKIMELDWAQTLNLYDECTVNEHDEES